MRIRINALYRGFNEEEKEDRILIWVQPLITDIQKAISVSRTLGLQDAIRRSHDLSITASIAWPDKSVAANDAEDARSLNRRVELKKMVVSALAPQRPVI